MRWWLAGLLVVGTAACGADGDTAATLPVTTSLPSTTGVPAATEPTTTSTAATTTEAPRPEVPLDVLVAVPNQQREDPAKGQFQVQVVNGTDERFRVTSVQFVWDGFTTAVTPKDSIVVGGQTISFPVPFPGAECGGSGFEATPPDVTQAAVLLGLDDGSTRGLPVVDRYAVAQKLYVKDCERQAIEDMVTFEWADLHEEELDGRPVTAGVLRATRGSGSGRISIESISNTIPYDVQTVDTAIGETVLVLEEGADVAEVPIRFVEARCDPHALAEIKQPHKFVAQVDFGDGVLRPYVVIPDESAWGPMRTTADEACYVTGQAVDLGDEAREREPAPPP